MLQFLCLILVLIGFFFPKSRLLTVLVFLFVWILNWNTNIADYINYELIYKHHNFRDLGYGVLCSFFYRHGVRYLDFKLLLSAIALFLYCRFILKYAYYCGLVAVLYLMFLSQLDITQSRNFYAFSIFLCALPYLFEDSLRSKLCYVFFIIAASLLHISVAFYLLFLFVQRKNLNSFKSIMKSFLILGLVVFILFFVYPSGMSDGRIEQYSRITSIFTKITICLLIVLNIVYLRSYRKGLDKKNYCLTLSQYTFIINPSDVVIYMNIAMFFLIPLAWNSLDYMRLFRLLAIVNFVFATNCIAMMKKKTFRMVAVFAYASLFFFLAYFMHTNTFIEDVVSPLFRQNLLLN